MTKVSELQGAELDYWVAKAEGYTRAQYEICGRGISSSWAVCGPIIERELLSVRPHDDTNWEASGYRKGFCYSIVQIGKTPLEAAMRCYVASKFGEKVEAQ